MSNNILIVGANSFLAKNAVEYLKGTYNCILTSRMANNRKNVLDLEDEKSIKEFCLLNDDLKVQGILFFQGINPLKNTSELTPEHFHKMCKVNLVGPALLIKYFHQNIDTNGIVLFMSSVSARKGSYDPAYAATKAGINGLVQSLANEFSAIRFNIIALGLVEDSPVYKNMTPDFREKHASKMNNKFIQAGDVSSMIVELLKNHSINKATINIDRGFVY